MEEFWKDQDRFAQQRLQVDHPTLYSKYKINTERKYVLPKPKGYYKNITAAIMKELLSKGVAQKTQKEVLDKVRLQDPSYTISDSLWSKPLNKYTRAQINTILAERMANPVSIRGCRSLSDVKRRIVLREAEENADYTIKAKIQISGNILIVGKETYPIIDRKSGEYEYKSVRIAVNGKRQWIRIDALLSLLR